MDSVTDKLKFKGGNPGAVQYGNFINYYQFHPPEERIQLLQKNRCFLPRKPCTTALDIGCNAGNLTVSLSHFLSENVNECAAMLAVDIDPTLIERAKQQLAADNINFICLDIMDSTKRDEIMSYLTKKNLTMFNVTFCFSTTMWIHLNYGDLGLHNFLKYVSSISEILVIEPQQWKCYKTAMKRMKQNNFTFPHYSALKMRESVEKDIDNILVNECGMEKLMESERTMWGRKLLFYRQQSLFPLKAQNY